MLANNTDTAGRRPRPSDIRVVPIWPGSMINAFLICTPTGCILVDTGLPGTENAIASVLESAGLTWTDIDLIVITHAHIDHAGNAAAIRERSGAPIVGHTADTPYFLGEDQMTFCATGWFGRVFKATGAIAKPYAPFTPDISLDTGQTLDLADYGALGHVLPTPGHTQGSISVLVDGSHAFVGDLISSGILLGGLLRKGRAKRPPFEDDPAMVGASLEDLVRAGATTFYLGHGDQLPHTEVLRHVDKLLTTSRSGRSGTVTTPRDGFRA